ncbi:Atxe2 family lasso peptide isopeptidase [Sphingomonas sp. G-3-2-10]|uniref:Atxe2 family lasso peptide isopeptidase n=1 Tax=Sphingomonas sp. G-3-2-10 TaxID=2728838 RepID=UPI00146D4D3D|nr:Atxe2 family lasso peptide isopeptidase [Sphingomonas sp. G-3-2-10]NML08056.1 Atxe2 family lasso peptide isopeptidase [Sphingomonas sp. G-3-2-10]
MVKRSLSIAGWALLACMTGVAHATPPACGERLLPPSPGAATGQRPITAHDLIELRDFGTMFDTSRRPSFSLSPDGRYAALILRRADPERDDYCFGVMLVPLDGRADPRLLDVGGEFIQAVTDPYGVTGVPSGLPVTEPPVWSPDGTTLAYLRRDKGQTQIWRVGLDGAPARQITQLTTEPRNLAWSKSGSILLFTTRRLFDAGVDEIEREGRSGFLYDERFWSVAYSRPTPRLPLPTEINALDLATGGPRIVTSEQAAILRGERSMQIPAEARISATSPSAGLAWVASERADRPRGPTLLRVQAAGKELPCHGEVCHEPIAGLWWNAEDMLFILRGGNADNGGRSALYRWRPGAEPGPRLLLDTEDFLAGCGLAGTSLICARESATRPRVLVRIDPGTGRSTTVFDPNRQFAEVRLGKAERLTWTDRDGVRTYGDLVLPPDHKPGQRHPLIVVQYISRGFLRGGQGDEYPIQLLASRGYAVLNFNWPAEAPAAAATGSDEAAQRVKVSNWSGRRRIFTALEAGIDTAIAKGVVDPALIGITGLSDGASTVQFALINSTRFKAAIMSTCCDDPNAVFNAGPGYGNNVVKDVGYPPAGSDGRAFWRPQSIAVNADRLKVPLLMHLPDGEFRMAQEAFAALRSHDAPVEMYVFPDEWHTKHHPAHRLAIYGRNIAWFDFWLRGLESDDPERSAEIARWKLLRDASARAL